MRELKLKYFIDLVSNVGPKAKTDAKALQEAQAVMTAAITGTNNKFLDYNKLTALAGKNTGMMKEVLTGTTDKFLALERAMAAVGRNTSVERQIGYLQRLTQATDRALQSARRLNASGGAALSRLPETAAAVGAGGYAARAVMAPPIRAYSSLEDATQDLRIAMTDASGQVSKDFDKISAEAVKLGNQLPGTTKDFMMAARALVTQGVPSSVAANGGLRASSYVGALLNLPQGGAAEVIAKLREAHGLKDDELVPMADLVQRAFFGFGIKPQDYLETAKYAASTYNTMGITGLAKTRETLAIQGMAANVGLEASSFGTNYSAMLTRLGQIDPRLAKKSKEAREIKDMLGEHGISMSFYGEDGAFKGNRNMLEQLAQLRGLNPLQQNRVIHNLFGTEAGRPAQIMVQKGLEAYEAALKTIDNQGSLDTRITMKMETFASKLEALSGTIENVMAKIAAQTGNSLKPVMDATNNLVGGPIGNFFDANPAAGTLGLLGAGGLGAWLTGRLATGAVGMLRGGAAAAGAGGATAGAGLLPMLGVAGSGLFAGYEMMQMGGALSDLYNISNREGVRLNPAAAARMTVLPSNTDFTQLMQPGATMDSNSLGAPGLTIGDGRLAIDVRILDDRVTATTRVEKPMSLVRIDNGNTNPAGYGLPR